MKKNFKYYAAIWAILFVLFQLVVFLMRPFLPGFEVHYDARFWISWGCVVAAFLGNLICAYIVFQKDSLSKVFYNLPLITISRAALIAVLVFGCAFMLIPDFPAWVAAIVCLVILAFNAIAIVKAGWAANVVADVDQKIKAQTSMIKKLTNDAEDLVSRAKSDSVRGVCKQVYDAVRYSDPMSNRMLTGIESEIAMKMGEFADAVRADDEDIATSIAKEIIVLVGNRNRKCKALK